MQGLHHGTPHQRRAQTRPHLPARPGTGCASPPRPAALGKQTTPAEHSTISSSGFGCCRQRPGLLQQPCMHASAARRADAGAPAASSAAASRCVAPPCSAQAHVAQAERAGATVGLLAGRLRVDGWHAVDDGKQAAAGGGAFGKVLQLRRRLRARLRSKAGRGESSRADCTVVRTLHGTSVRGRHGGRQPNTGLQQCTRLTIPRLNAPSSAANITATTSPPVILPCVTRMEP